MTGSRSGAGLSTSTEHPDAPRRGTKAAAGSYLLLLRTREEVSLRVGKLGDVRFVTGWYVYCGSAHGPGGLQARLARHLRTDKQIHWHVDYLRTIAAVEGVFATESDLRLECTLAAGVGQLPEAVPVPGFGASDCRCLTHLFGFVHWPDLLRLPVVAWPPSP